MVVRAPFLALAHGSVSALSHCLLLEDLWELFSQDLLKSNWALMFLVQDGTESELRGQLDTRFSVVPTTQRKAFFEHLHFFPLTSLLYNELSNLNEGIAALNQRLGCEGNYLFYPSEDLSTYLRIIHTLGLSRPPEVKGFRRILIELPMQQEVGPLRSANRELQEIFREEQIYRRVPGLSQPLLNQLLGLRFGNGLFEPLWNHHHIQYVEITLGQKQLQSPLQSQLPSSFAPQIAPALLQILAILAMEPPVLSSENALRNEMLKVFLSLRELEPSELSEIALRGVLPTNSLSGNLSESLIQSLKETYLAQRVYIDNGRWAGTPFYLRAGLGLPLDCLELVVHFHPFATRLFPEESAEPSHNSLWIRLFPEFSLNLSLNRHAGGHSQRLSPLSLNGSGLTLPTQPTLQASSQTLLLDCLVGNPALFLRDDSVETLEKYLEPLKKSWQRPGNAPYFYLPGFWGPAEAESLFEDLHCRWRLPGQLGSEEDEF